MTYQLEKQVVDRLKDFFEHYDFIDKVVIFGSRAKHNANPKSDIDLCIYSLEMNDVQFSKLKLALDELPILYKIDIVHFEKSNEALRENVARDGKLLFVKTLEFDKFFKTKPSKSYQIETKDYLESGTYSVVDQGQKFIVAYSDNEDKLYRIEEPVIIFGDHTRIIKYIDFDFIIGADGTKILLPFDDTIDAKYAYYQLLFTKIESLGYSRHFKVLKEKTFYKPSITKQKEIAQTLDKASELIELRKATILKLDELAQSIFIDMFGDPISNNKQTTVKGFLEIFNVTTGKLDSNASEENGVYPFFTCAQETLKINQFAFDFECLLLAGNNAAGKYSVKYYNGKFNAYQRTYILTLKNHLSSYKFFKYALEMKLSELQNKSIGSNTKYLTLKILERVKMFDPTREKQQEFTFQIEKIETQKSFYEAELTQLQATFDALLSQSFEG